MMQHTKLQRGCVISKESMMKAHRRTGVFVPRAQGSHATPGSHYNPYPSIHTQQPTGIYYGSNPPQPAPPYQEVPAGYSTHNTYPPQPPPYQRTPYDLGEPGSSTSGLASVNPGRTHINSVRLMGIITEPQRQGRCTYATIQVPFATKEGIQSFLVESWDTVATQMIGLNGAQVVVDGRLAQDVGSAGVKVIVNRIQLVDQTLPASGYRSSQAGDSGTAREGRSAATALDPQQVWRQHYTSSARSLKALASHFKVQSATLAKALFVYAFQSKSPLHWRVLAEEAGLGPKDDLQLLDFMTLVSMYKDSIDAMYEGSKPGAVLPPLPITNDGLLKVKPIREWALALPPTSTAYYTVKEYEAKHGLSMLYDALRMGVVAEATKGAWSYDSEFGSE